MKNNNSRILIVDDVSQNIQVVGNILKSEGYNINFAQSGKKALENIKNISFDLILLDIMMPEMSGFEVCEKLKENVLTKDIPIIFLTAKDDEQSISKGFEIGGVDYITKPFKKEELIARVKTHLTIKKQEINLSNLNKTKDKFFSIIAHDLKNPFNQIIGFSELLIKKINVGDLEKSKQFAEIILESSKSAHTLLDNLLEWSKSQTNRISFTPDKVYPHGIIVETFGLMKNAALQKKITLINELPDDLTVFADMNMVTTVLRNLVSNAIKFTNADGLIKVYHKINSNNLIQITIEDTGVGMKTETVSKLFKIDSNFSTVGTNHEKGTGLGLILCKEFVEKNGGEIWAESEPTVGSKFHFTLNYI